MLLLFPLMAAFLSHISAASSPPSVFSKSNSNPHSCTSPLLLWTPSCYDPTTHKCCPGTHNLCLIDQVCAAAEGPNGRVLSGCCPRDASVCGDRCFDAVVHKCCTGRRGKYGLCPRGTDCCEGMCCAVGEVCVAGTAGMMCWPKGGRTEVGAEEKKNATGSTGAGIGASEAKNTGGRLVPPHLLSVLVLPFLLFAAAMFTLNTVPFDQPPHPATPSIPQLLNPRADLAKRWSCHAPKVTCGVGCFKPTESKCCGAGLCPTGLVCCGQYCCPKGTTCKQELAMNWCVWKPKAGSALDFEDDWRRAKDGQERGDELDDAELSDGVENFAGGNVTKEERP